GNGTCRSVPPITCLRRADGLSSLSLPPPVKLRHAPGDFHPPLYLATLSASPTTVVALRTTQTTNQGFVSFAASPNNALERVTVAPAIRPATSGLIALPSVPARFYKKIRCWGN